MEESDAERGMRRTSGNRAVAAPFFPNGLTGDR